MNFLKLTVAIFIWSGCTILNAQSIPFGSSWTVTQNKNVKVHTYMSPAAMFANTSHIILASKNKEEFKTSIIKKYPDYGGEQLVDIYLNYYLKPKNWVK